MGKVLKKIGIISSLASRYIGIIIIAFPAWLFSGVTDFLG